MKTKNKRIKELLEGKEITEDELNEEYNNFLDECFGDVEICGLTYSSSHALENVDPVAYRCGQADWLDSNEDIIQHDGKDYWRSDFDKAVEFAGRSKCCVNWKG